MEPFIRRSREMLCISAMVFTTLTAQLPVSVPSRISPERNSSTHDFTDASETIAICRLRLPSALTHHFGLDSHQPPHLAREVVTLCVRWKRSCFDVLAIFCQRFSHYSS